MVNILPTSNIYNFLFLFLKMLMNANQIMEMVIALMELHALTQLVHLLAPAHLVGLVNYVHKVRYARMQHFFKSNS